MNKFKPELKSCPFCGGEVFIDWNGVTGHYYVKCNSCKLVAGFPRFNGVESDMVKDWNTRSGDKQEQKAVEPNNTKDKEVEELARELAQVGMGYDFKGGGFRLNKRYIRIAEYLLSKHPTKEGVERLSVGEIMEAIEIVFLSQEQRNAIHTALLMKEGG